MGDEKYLSHLSTLKEIILDEERLVTYVSISKELCLHVNESKSLMNKVVEEIRKKQSDIMLNVTYIISGLTNDNKAQTTVCPEDEITDYRSRLKLVFFEHIYSINKGKPSVDKVAFMSITTFEDYQLCSGLLKNNVCSKLTLDEISKLKSSSQVAVAEQTVTKPPPPKKIKEEKVKDKLVNGDAKHLEIKSEPTVKQEKTSPQKNVSPQKSAINGNKQKPDVKNTNKSQKGIAGFFSRSDSAPAKKSAKETKKNEPDIKIKLESNAKEIDEQMDVDIEDKGSETNKTDDKPVISNGIKTKDTGNTAVKNKSKSSNKSLTQIKKNAKVDKKRKRVLHVSDSESDEDKNDPFVDDEDVLDKKIDVESEDEIPPTPAVNTVKVASNMLNPRKRRKIVNKTYTDEEGFILTRKEEVYESMSENEDIDMKENVEKDKVNKDAANEKTASVKSEVSPTNKKSAPKNNKKKISPPQKGKQATLMSFFKKA
ncbi:DNA polymerase delta subunit 3 [Leguminivora glycinivorella]|uniref:DNA polymerase delta subunit 3 n=1 Tax=Leguminivora glycinivorella TaxID=1035111 RepID=UPI0020105D7C|nr:DNA polymerase delta subunit 3 [Leguminivora glycinivorella]